MKFINLCLLIILLSAPKAFSQIYGPAIVFSYDQAGNRIQRKFITNAQLDLYKPGHDSTTQHPIDTIKEDFALKAVGQDLQVIAYPNPVTTALIIENKNWQSSYKGELKLYDVTGRLLQSKPISQPKETLYFGDVSSGIYTVIYYLDDKMLTNWKVIKNNTN